MTTLIKFKVRDIFRQNKLLLIVNFIIFCFFCSINIHEAELYNFNTIEFALLRLIDHYYILYCLFPILLIILATYFKQEDNIFKIRYITKKQIISKDLKVFLCWLSLYLFMHILLAILISSFFLRFSFLTTSFEFHGYSEIILLLQSYNEIFAFPLVSLVISVGYFIFGWLVLVCLLSYLNTHATIKHVILLAIAIFITTFIGFQTNIDNLIPFIFFNNYFILHHVLIVKGVQIFALIFLFGSSIIVFLICQNKKNSSSRYVIEQLLLPRKTVKLTFSFLLIVFIIEGLKIVTSDSSLLLDSIFSFVHGSSQQNPSFLGWMKQLFLNIGPIFIIGIYQSKFNKYNELHLIIRQKSKAVLRANRVFAQSKFLLKYAFFIVIILCLSYMSSQSTLKQSLYHEALERHSLEHKPHLIFAFFLFIFVVQFLFNYVVFIKLSNVFGEVIAFIGILILSSLLFYANVGNVILINSGLAAMIEMLSKDTAFLYMNTGLIILLIIIFYYVHLWRYIYGNYKISGYNKKISK